MLRWWSSLATTTIIIGIAGTGIMYDIVATTTTTVSRAVAV